MAVSIGVSFRWRRTAPNPRSQFNAYRRAPSVSLITAATDGPAPAPASRALTSVAAVAPAAIVRRVAEQLPIAVLVSGAGTNLQALLDTVHEREARIVAVASSAADAPALARARQRDVPTAVFARGDYADRAARDEALGDWLAQQGARLVVLAGYMELLGVAFLARFRAAVINVHPSLLPAFPGIGAVAQALSYGVQVFGVTVHFVDEGVDTGPVILQRAIDLPDARDEGEVLSALRPLEHALLPQAVRLFARGALRIDPADPRHPLAARPAGASADWPAGLRVGRPGGAPHQAGGAGEAPGADEG
jgi:phosphoribosylglycinamide formyltransferase 1